MMNTHVRDNFSFLTGYSTGSNGDTRTFTNTSFADLDALTGGSGTIAAVSVTVDTSTDALVLIGTSLMDNTGGTTILGYRVSGATTIAAGDVHHVLTSSTTNNNGANGAFHQASLNAGSNVFELQARVTAGTGQLDDCYLTVIPLPG
jgi:hypothetical protein